MGGFNQGNWRTGIKKEDFDLDQKRQENKIVALEKTIKKKAMAL